MSTSVTVSAVPAFVSTIEVFRRLAASDFDEPPNFRAMIQARTLARGDLLFDREEERPDVFVVNQGIIKMVYETAQGSTWIKGFAGAGTCFASLTALTKGGQTSYSACACVPSKIDQIPFDGLQELANRHLVWQRILANAFKMYGQRKEQREMELLTQSAEQRYLRFLKQAPELVAHLTQREIASYIRVTPVALSRIRARLKAKGALC